MRDMFLPDEIFERLVDQIVRGIGLELWSALINVGREPDETLVHSLVDAAEKRCILTGGPDRTGIMLVLGAVGRIWRLSLLSDLD